MEGRLEVPIYVAQEIFSVSNPIFMVGGPLSDGNLQVDVAEDHIQYQSMIVTGEKVGSSAAEGIINPSFEFPSASPARTIVGRLKLSIPAARQLAALLLAHATKAEEAMSGVAAGSGDLAQS